MRGHEALLSMRMKGKVPRAVAVETDLSGAHNLAKSWPTLGTGFAHIAIDPSESLEGLDLRCMASLRVHIHGEDEKRVAAVFEAITAAGASRVLASVFRRKGEEFETVRMFDSESVLVWPI